MARVGRPRKSHEDGSATLQHSYWTRDRLLGTVTLQCAHGLLTPKDGEMLSRLRAEFMGRFFPRWDASEHVVRELVMDWLDGKSEEWLIARYEVERSTIRRWTRGYAYRCLLACWLDGSTPADMESLAHELGVPQRTRYHIQDRFLAAASAALARESLLEQCRNTHGSIGGDGAVPVYDRRLTQRVGTCASCIALRAFDRYGELRVAQEQLGDGREAGTEPAAGERTGLAVVLGCEDWEFEATATASGASRQGK